MEKNINLIVKEDENNLRLDVFINKRENLISRTRIKYVLDGGKCQIGVESTIINLLNKPTILRFGGLDILKIEKILKNQHIKQLNR